MIRWCFLTALLAVNVTFAQAGRETPKPLEVTSTAFAPGCSIPKKYAYKGEGENLSPGIRWSSPPGGTRSLAMICDDPDAPRSTPWVHWIVYGIKPAAASLQEGTVGGAIEGKNDFGSTGWGGPMPPKGKGTHHYHFRLYALDRELLKTPGLTKEALLKAMQGHVLATGELIGTYAR